MNGEGMEWKNIKVPEKGEWAKHHPEVPLKDMLEDPAIDLVAMRGKDEAIEELNRRIEQNPNDTEAIRQRNLIKEHLSELIDRISKAEKGQKGTVH
jgi:hypothetical protein